MRVSITELRQNIYQLIDECLESGDSIEIERRGRLVRIVPETRKSRLAGLKPHNVIIGDPEELVHCDWSVEWRPGSL